MPLPKGREQGRSSPRWGQEPHGTGEGRSPNPSILGTHKMQKDPTKLLVSLQGESLGHTTDNTKPSSSSCSTETQAFIKIPGKHHRATELLVCSAVPLGGEFPTSPNPGWKLLSPGAPGLSQTPPGDVWGRHWVTLGPPHTCTGAAPLPAPLELPKDSTVRHAWRILFFCVFKDTKPWRSPAPSERLSKDFKCKLGSCYTGKIVLLNLKLL